MITGSGGAIRNKEEEEKDTASGGAPTHRIGIDIEVHDWLDGEGRWQPSSLGFQRIGEGARGIRFRAAMYL